MASAAVAVKMASLRFIPHPSSPFPAHILDSDAPVRTEPSSGASIQPTSTFGSLPVCGSGGPVVCCLPLVRGYVTDPGRCCLVVHRGDSLVHLGRLAER